MGKRFEPIISYSQNAEDVVLGRVFSHIDSGFYVDVGAWHPADDSVTKIFYDRGWSGINVEPQVERMKVFKKERPRDINLSFAVSARAGPLSFWVPHYSALATCCREMLDPDIPDYSEPVEQVVEAIRLDSLLLEYAKDRTIHFLKIDVEGYEKTVIDSASFDIHRPVVLVVEAISPRTGEPSWHYWEPILLSKGYLFALFDGLNRFYVRRESSELLSELAIPANCLDGFVTRSEMIVRAQLVEAQKQLRVTLANSITTEKNKSTKESP